MSVGPYSSNPAYANRKPPGTWPTWEAYWQWLTTNNRSRHPEALPPITLRPAKVRRQVNVTPSGQPAPRILSTPIQGRRISVAPGSNPARFVNIPLRSMAAPAAQRPDPIATNRPVAQVAADIFYRPEDQEAMFADRRTTAPTSRKSTKFVNEFVAGYKAGNRITANKATVDIWRSMNAATETAGAQKAIQTYLSLNEAIQQNPETAMYFYDTEGNPVLDVDPKTGKRKHLVTEVSFQRFRSQGGDYTPVDGDHLKLLVGMTPDEAAQVKNWIRSLRTADARLTREERVAIDRFVMAAGAQVDSAGSIVKYGDTSVIPDWAKVLEGVDRYTMGHRNALPNLRPGAEAAKEIASFIGQVNKAGGFFVSTNGYEFDEPKLGQMGDQFKVAMPRMERHLDALALTKATVPDPLDTLHGGVAPKSGLLSADGIRETRERTGQRKAMGVAHNADADVLFLPEFLKHVETKANLHGTILAANKAINPIGRRKNELFSFDSHSIQDGDVFAALDGMEAGEHDLIFDVETGEKIDWFRNGALSTRTHYAYQGTYYDPEVKQYRAMFHNTADNYLHVISSDTAEGLADRIQGSFEHVRASEAKRLEMMKSHRQDKARRQYVRMHQSTGRAQQFERLERLYGAFGKITAQDARLIERQQWDTRLSTGQTVQAFLGNAWRWRDRDGNLHDAAGSALENLSLMARRLRGEAKTYNQAINHIRSSFSGKNANYDMMQALAIFHEELNHAAPLETARKLLRHERHQVKVGDRHINLGSKRRTRRAIYSIIGEGARKSIPGYETIRENSFVALVKEMQKNAFGIEANKPLLDATEATAILGDLDSGEALHYKVLRLTNTLFGKQGEFTAKSIPALALNKAHKVSVADTESLAERAVLAISQAAHNDRLQGKGVVRHAETGNLVDRVFDYGPLMADLDLMKSKGIHLKEALDKNLSRLTGINGIESEARVFRTQGEGNRFGIGIAFFDKDSAERVRRVSASSNLATRLADEGADYIDLGVFDPDNLTWEFNNTRRNLRTHYGVNGDLVKILTEKSKAGTLRDILDDDNAVLALFRRHDSTQEVLQWMNIMKDTYAQAVGQYGRGNERTRKAVANALATAFGKLSDTTDRSMDMTGADLDNQALHQFTGVMPLMRVREAIKANKPLTEILRIAGQREPYMDATEEGRHLSEIIRLMQKAPEQLRRPVNGFDDVMHLSGNTSEAAVTKSMLTSRSARSLVPFSEADPRSRAHIEQMQRALPLAKTWVPGAHSYAEKGPLLMTESGLERNRKLDFRRSASMRTLVTDDDAILKRFGAGADAERRLAALNALGMGKKDILPFMSTHEQQIAMRDSSAQALDTTLHSRKIVRLNRGEVLAGELAANFNAETGEFTPFTVTDENVSSFTRADGRAGKGTQLDRGSRVTGVTVNQEGNLVLDIEQDRALRNGGKVLNQGDKGIIHRWRDDLFDLVYGDWDEAEQRYVARFDMVANFNVAKHEDYSMAVRGHIEDAIDHLNRIAAKGGAEREEALERLGMLAEQINHAFGWTGGDRARLEMIEGRHRIVVPDELPVGPGGVKGFGTQAIKNLSTWIKSQVVGGQRITTSSELGHIIRGDAAAGRQNDSFNHQVDWEDEGGASFGRRERAALRDWGTMSRTLAVIDNERQMKTLEGRVAARSYADSLLSLAGKDIGRSDAPTVRIGDLRRIEGDVITDDALRGTILNPRVNGKSLLSEQVKTLEELDWEQRQGVLSADEATEKAMAMHGGYWLDMSDLSGLEGANGKELKQSRIWVPLTGTSAIAGEHQLSEVQYKLRNMHDAYADVMTTLGLSNDPDPKVRNQTLTRKEAATRFIDSIDALSNQQAKELTAKTGQAAKNLKVRMAESGRGQAAGLPPALTQQFIGNGAEARISPGMVKAITEEAGGDAGKAQQMIGDMNRKIKEAAAMVDGEEMFREGDVWMTRGKAKAMGMSDDMVDSVLSGKQDIFGLTVRYPTFHDEALSLGRIRIMSDDLATKHGMAPDDDRFFMTAGTAARLRGDYDGDELSLWISHDGGVQQEWKDAYESDRYQKALYRSVKDARDKEGKLRRVDGSQILDWDRLFGNDEHGAPKEWIAEGAGDTTETHTQRLQKKYIGPISNKGLNLREATYEMHVSRHGSGEIPLADQEVYDAVKAVTDVFEQKGISAKHAKGRPMGEIILEALQGGKHADQAWQDMLAQDNKTGKMVNALGISEKQWGLFKRAASRHSEGNLTSRIFSETGLSADETVKLYAGESDAINTQKTRDVLEAGGRLEAIAKTRSAAVAGTEHAMAQAGINVKAVKSETARREARAAGQSAAQATMGQNTSRVDHVAVQAGGESAEDRTRRRISSSLFRGSTDDTLVDRIGHHVGQAGGGGALMALAGMAAVGFAASTMSGPRNMAPLMPENKISLQQAPAPLPPQGNPANSNRAQLEQGDPEGYELRVRGRSTSHQPVGDMVSRTLSDSGVGGNVQVTERDDTSTLTTEWVRGMVAGLLK